MFPTIKHGPFQSLFTFYHFSVFEYPQIISQEIPSNNDFFLGKIGLYKRWSCYFAVYRFFDNFFSLESLSNFVYKQCGGRNYIDDLLKTGLSSCILLHHSVRNFSDKNSSSTKMSSSNASI